MVSGYDISQLKGTPLYDIARNANVYGGKTLSKTEMVFFQQQCREMGFDPAKYGLEVMPEDLEGADYKETQKAQKNLTNAIDQAYQGQFGKKNNAVETAKGAETKAYAIINTAKEAFVRNHGDVNFTPESLGQRPNFTAPEYKNNLTKYVSDLNAWGNKVAEQYRNADNMTNEQLAAQIMDNDDANTGLLAGITLAVGDELKANMDENTAAILKGIQDGTAKIIDQIKDSEGNIKQTIRSAEGHICQVVRNSAGQIIKVVRQEGAHTRAEVHNEGAHTRATVHNEGAHTRAEVHNEGAHTRATVRNEGAHTRGTVRAEGAHTRAEVHAEADRVIDTLDPTHLRRAAAWVRDQAANAGQTVFEFIQANPGMVVGAAAGLPAGTAGVPLGALAGHLIFD